MYSVATRIEFCYGHRLLDYDGVCRHAHGHSATAEVEVQTSSLDTRHMVVDFVELRRMIKEWIDRELDHKMILRRDDPLVPALEALGEPVVVVESNPTVELLARMIFDFVRDRGYDVVAVRVWETPSSYASCSGK